MIDKTHISYINVTDYLFMTWIRYITDSNEFVLAELQDEGCSITDCSSLMSLWGFGSRRR